MENVITVKANIVLTEDNSYRLVDSKNDGIQVGVVVFKDGDITVYHRDNSSENYPNVNDFMDYLNKNDLKFMSMTSGNHRWKKYNPNPEDKNTGDCSIRAYCAAFKLDWNKAYDIASKMGKSMAELPDSGRVVKSILENEFGMHVMEESVTDDGDNADHHEDLLDNDENDKKKKKKDKKRKVAKMTINEFAMTHPFGTYVCLQRGHATTVIDGEYWDSWDSGDKKISEVWTK